MAVDEKLSITAKIALLHRLLFLYLIVIGKVVDRNLTLENIHALAESANGIQEVFHLEEMRALIVASHRGFEGTFMFCFL
jgi:hypothetical protein